MLEKPGRGTIVFYLNILIAFLMDTFVLLIPRSFLSIIGTIMIISSSLVVFKMAKEK